MIREDFIQECAMRIMSHYVDGLAHKAFIGSNDKSHIESITKTCATLAKSLADELFGKETKVNG